MKVLSFALMSAVAAVTTASKAHSQQHGRQTRVSKKEVNALLQSGRVDRKRLLENAIPYDQGKGSRSLEDAYFEVTGQMSVKFNSCRSLSIQDDNLLAEGYLELASAGELISQRSYVVIDLCTHPDGCDDDSYHEYTRTYMVDIDTFIASTLGYMPQEVEEYCTGCQANSYFCSNVGYKSTDASGLAYFYKGEKYEIIDCSVCSNLQCFNQYGQYEANGWDEVAEYIEGMSCMAMNSGYQLSTESIEAQLDYVSAGWICDDDGDAFEIGIFADQYCTLYVPNAKYIDFIESGSTTWTYMYKSQEALNFMFTNKYECFGGETQYVNDYQQINGDDPCSLNEYGQYNDIDECEEQLEEMYANIGDVCDQLTADAINLDTCNTNGNNNNGNNNNYNNNGQDMWQQYMTDMNFDVISEYQYDTDAMCAAVASDVLAGSNYNNVYDSSRSGTYQENEASSSFFPSIPDARTVKQAAVDPSKVHPLTFASIAVLIGGLFFIVFYFMKSEDDAPVDPDVVEVKEEYVLA